MTGTMVPEALTRNALIRTEVFDRIGLFDARFAATGNDDWDLFARLHESGGTICWSDEAVVEETFRVAYDGGIYSSRRLSQSQRQRHSHLTVACVIVNASGRRIAAEHQGNLSSYSFDDAGQGGSGEGPPTHLERRWDHGRCAGATRRSVSNNPFRIAHRPRRPVWIWERPIALPFGANSSPARGAGNGARVDEGVLAQRVFGAGVTNGNQTCNHGLRGSGLGIADGLLECHAA